MYSRKWYLDVMLGVYLILCGVSSIRYLLMDISIMDGHVPYFTQMLCFGATFASVLYFFYSRVGCAVLAVITLLAASQAAIVYDAKAIVFHSLIFAVLAYNIACSLRNRQTA